MYIITFIVIKEQTTTSPSITTSVATETSSFLTSSPTSTEASTSSQFGSWKINVIPNISKLLQLLKPELYLYNRNIKDCLNKANEQYEQKKHDNYVSQWDIASKQFIVDKLKEEKECADNVRICCSTFRFDTNHN